MILIRHNFYHCGFVPVAIVVLLYYTLSVNQLVVGVLGWTIIAPSSSSSSATTTRAHRSIINNYNNCHSSSITTTSLSSSSPSSPNTAILPTKRGFNALSRATLVPMRQMMNGWMTMATQTMISHRHQFLSYWSSSSVVSCVASACSGFELD